MLKIQTVKSMKVNNYGRITVEQCQILEINPLIRELRQEAQNLIQKAEIKVENLTIKLTTSKTKAGVRYWFQCPLCSKRVGKLYKHPLNNALGCRICLNLDYNSHRFKGMLERNLLKY